MHSDGFERKLLSSEQLGQIIVQGYVMFRKLYHYVALKCLIWHLFVKRVCDTILKVLLLLSHKQC